MNIQQLIIFLLEILYYTLFFNFCRKQDKFYKIFLMFLIANIGLFFIGFNTFYAYTLYFFEIMILCKILKIKLVLYDILVFIVSLFVKLFLELICFAIFRENIVLFIPVLIMGIFKNLFLILIRNLLNKAYINFKKVWDNNNFYIRYSFSTLLYLYIIASIVYIIVRW